MFIFVLFYILLGQHNPPKLQVCNAIINHILGTLYMVRKHNRHFTYVCCYWFFSYSSETQYLSTPDIRRSKWRMCLSKMTWGYLTKLSGICYVPGIESRSFRLQSRGASDWAIEPHWLHLEKLDMCMCQFGNFHWDYPVSSTKKPATLSM